MFVSGSLKDKTVNFYKSGIQGYSLDGIDTEKCFIYYNGELVFSPWDDSERKLSLNQNKHLDKVGEDVIGLFPHNEKCGTNYVFYTTEIKKLIALIKKTDRRISFALMQALYTNILHSRDVLRTINDFYDLVEYLNNVVQFLKQPDIDAILNLFTSGKSYNEEDVLSYKLKRYGTNEKIIDSSSALELFKYGEFLTPNRLAKVGRMLDSEYSEYVLPIYFSIKENDKAEKFLSLCRTYDLDRDLVEENANKLNVPENIISLIKK